jgi:hypothetical protein
VEENPTAAIAPTAQQATPVPLVMLTTYLHHLVVIVVSFDCICLTEKLSQSRIIDHHGRLLH